VTHGSLNRDSGPSLVLGPKGDRFYSPGRSGAQPWVWIRKRLKALKGRNISAIEMCPKKMPIVRRTMMAPLWGLGRLLCRVPRAAEASALGYRIPPHLGLKNDPLSRVVWILVRTWK